MDGETFPFSLKILFNCVLRVSDIQRFVKYFALLNIFLFILGIFFSSFSQYQKQKRKAFSYLQSLSLAPFKIQQKCYNQHFSNTPSQIYLKYLQESTSSALEIGSIPSNCESLQLICFQFGNYYKNNNQPLQTNSKLNFSNFSKIIEEQNLDL
ncbi:hypothetical protein ABPG74_005436 [Tetrahymena malaccensis]